MATAISEPSGATCGHASVKLREFQASATLAQPRCQGCREPRAGCRRTGNMAVERLAGAGPAPSSWPVALAPQWQTRAAHQQRARAARPRLAELPLVCAPHGAPPAAVAASGLTARRSASCNAQAARALAGRVSTTHFSGAVCPSSATTQPARIHDRSVSCFMFPSDRNTDAHETRHARTTHDTGDTLRQPGTLSGQPGTIAEGDKVWQLSII